MIAEIPNSHSESPRDRGFRSFISVSPCLCVKPLFGTAAPARSFGCPQPKTSVPAARKRQPEDRLTYMRFSKNPRKVAGQHRPVPSKFSHRATKAQRFRSFFSVSPCLCVEPFFRAAAPAHSRSEWPRGISLREIANRPIKKDSYCSADRCGKQRKKFCPQIFRIYETKEPGIQTCLQEMNLLEMNQCPNCSSDRDIQDGNI